MNQSMTVKQSMTVNVALIVFVSRKHVPLPLEGLINMRKHDRNILESNFFSS